MKKIIVLGVCLTAAIGAVFISLQMHKPVFKPGSREEYEAFLENHPYQEWLRDAEIEEENGVKEIEPRPDRPDLAFLQDYLRTMDPKLKRPVPESLYQLSEYTALFRDGKMKRAGRINANSLADATQWEERGPSEIGGRTRALLFDANDPQKKKVWAGGVSGGLWFNNDITDANSSWNKVDDLWDNLSISCIASDPNNGSIMYVGTGESHTGMRGAGVWKTTNGGTSWTRLTSTSNFLQIRDIAVRNESGTSVVYLAVHLDYGEDSPPDNAGLYRSTNGGTSWTQVLPNAEFGKPQTPTDIELGDNEIWVATKPTYGGATINSQIYKSTNGTSGWTNFDTGVMGQIQLAVAPSNPDVVYAIREKDGAVHSIIKTTNNGSTWSAVTKPVDADSDIPSNDYTRGQAWYDLAIAVSPTNANEVLVGGIDLFKTTNGGTSWTQLSKWWSGIAMTGPVVHADQHEIVYRPGASGEAIFGNDGGVYYSNNLSAGTSSAKADPRNKNYNVTQFYSGALHPTQANYMLAGAQDNGTQQFTLAGFGSTSEANGGDGAACFIDQLNPSIQIVSYVYNDYSISKDGGQTFSQLIDDPNTGSFINTAEYDSRQKFLYTARDNTSFYKIKVDVASPSLKTQTITGGFGSMPSAMRVSPHTTNQSNLFIGTDAGRLFKITNANGTSPVKKEITGSSFPNGSITGIAFGADENQIMVTFSNYGVINIWETRDGGTTWTNKEGDLPNMPVRWVEYHPNNPDQAFIATQLGVWSCDDLTATSPAWKSTNGGLANVRTDMLRIRKSDGIMMAATYGRGVYTALIPSQLAQEIAFDSLASKTFGDADFTLEASSTSNLPVTFTSSDPTIALITGSSVKILSGGTVKITANQIGNIYYKAADPVERTLVINKAAQTISFSALTTHDVNEAPFNLTATSSSNLNVAFSSSNAAVATIAGNKVTIKGVGTTTITASQVGNTNYLAAPSITHDLTIVSRIIKMDGDLEFGEVIVLEVAEKQFTISNTGTASINISEIKLPEKFTINPAVTANTEVKASESLTFTITFAPSDELSYGGNIEVISNATSGSNMLPVSGAGILITDAETKPGAGLEVFPNPVQDWLTIRGSDFSAVKEVTIVDQKGSSNTSRVESDTHEMRVNVSALSKGVYIIDVPLNGKLIQKKFSKQ